MSTLKLVIGSKNSSSWSLRPWLLLKQIGLAFEEVVVPLRRPDTRERIRGYSPSGKVPVLILGNVRIWDSLAIAEFLAEHDPALWPADSRARAIARSVSAEMHSGFQALRTFLPMDFTARFNPPGKLLSAVQADVQRIQEIWVECRQHHGHTGPFLFGSFTVADAMFAPVCSRFATYAVPLDPISEAYVERIMTLPAMLEWGRDAAAEVAAPESIGRPAAHEAAFQRLPPNFAPEVLAADIDRLEPERDSWEEETPPEPAPPPAAPPIVPVAAPPPASAAPPRDHSPAVVAVAPAPVERIPEPPPAAVPAPDIAPPQPRGPTHRELRPIPSTIMIKPIGDGTRRRR